MSRVYASSMLERKITELSQELKSLKTNQLYLTGQTRGYSSSKIRVHSVMDYSYSYDGVTYYYWNIYGKFKFTGDHYNAPAITNFHYQLYNSAGTPISVEILDAYKYDVVYWDAFESKNTSNPNEQEFYIDLYLVTTNSASSNFYGDFWCVSNDGGQLDFVERYSAE